MRTVLFVCTHNAGRSQMAEAFFARHAPPDLRAESAGQRPAREVWPQVVDAMAEVGIDLSECRPKKLTVEMQLHADWAITLACGGECPFVPTVVEDWDVPDPAERSLEEVRTVRDAIEAKVRELLDTRAEAIRADRSAHELRLERLLPRLVEEFGASHEPKQIRMAADAALTDFQEVPVRSFVMSLAYRKARERLRTSEMALGGSP